MLKVAQNLLPWSLRLFGGATLADPDGQLIELPTRKATQVLALAALSESGTVSRDSVASILWPEADLFEARNRLNVTLSRLRSATDGLDIPLTIERSTISVRRDLLECDAVKFRALRRRAFRTDDDFIRLQLLRDALQLVTGDFMAGFDEAWAEHERQSFRRDLVLVTTRAVAVINAKGDFLQALPRIMSAAKTIPADPDINRILSSVKPQAGYVDWWLYGNDCDGRLAPPRAVLSDNRSTWDSGADFTVSANPNGCWSFGWSWDLDQPVSLFREAARVTLHHKETYDRLRSTSWVDLCASHYDGIAQFDSPEFTIRAGQLLLHPGPLGQKAVAKWTSPERGRYEISCRFYAIVLDTTTDVHLSVGGEWVISGVVRPAERSISWEGCVEADAGVEITAVVGAYDDGYFSDSTGLELRIRRLAII